MTSDLILFALLYGIGLWLIKGQLHINFLGWHSDDWNINYFLQSAQVPLSYPWIWRPKPWSFKLGLVIAPDMPIIIYNVVYCTQSIPTGGCFARNPPGWKSLNNTVVFKGINRSVEHKETKPDKNILRPYIDDSTWWSCFKIEEEHRGFWEIPLDYKRSQSGGTGLGVSKPNNMYI